MNHAEPDTIVKLRRIGEKSSRTIKVINPNAQKENLISRGVIYKDDISIFPNRIWSEEKIISLIEK